MSICGILDLTCTEIAKNFSVCFFAVVTGMLNIFLVGPMGTGKSTIGRILSENLHLEFVDSDSEIEKRTGAAISWVFDVEGEAGFRARETAVIDDLTRRAGIVLATGGGSVKAEANRTALASRGTVIYLYTPVEKQFQRTCKDKKRPLLQNSDPKGTLEKLMRERDPLYRQVADLVVDTSELGIRAVVQTIIRQLQQKGLVKE